MPVAPADLDSPEFPHGTLTGYTKGCRNRPCPATPSCAAAASRKWKQKRLRQAGALPPAGTERTEVGPVHDHLHALIEAVPGVSFEAVARATGVSAGTIRLIYRGKHKTVTQDVADRIMAVTAEQVADAAVAVPVGAKIRQMLRSMQAQGFPVAWQAQRYGTSPDTLFDILSGRLKTMPHSTLRRVMELAAEVEGKQGPSPYAAGRARKAGWYPLDYYDDDGNLFPGVVGEEARRAADRERQARDRLAVLSMSVNGVPTNKIAERVGVDKRVVGRYRAEIGLKVVDLWGTWVVAPECRPLAAKIRRAALAYESAESSTDSALDIVRRDLGLMGGRARTGAVA